MKLLLFIQLISLFTLSACANDKTLEKNLILTIDNESDTLKKAYFASGCFWCVEAIYESVEGVIEAVSGYTGGKEMNPNYLQVSAGKTGHAEAVLVYYDSTKITYEQLLDVFFDSHDPTTLNQQGPDAGKQYRSAIFYQNEYEKNKANEKIKHLLDTKTYPFITTEVVPFSVFYPAEDYHQNFEKSNPLNPYVQSVSLPRLQKFQQKNPAILKKE
jgi:peptide-methionine (S)-S-oxide reductase